MDDWKLEPAHDIGLHEPERWRSLRRESGLLSTGIHIAAWTVVQVYLSLWHRLKIEHWGRVPAEPPFILCANHSSHLDTLVLASQLSWRLRDRVFPLAAGDVFFERPAKSAFAATVLNALPIWRKKCGVQAIRELRQRLLQEPCAFILFPEGARSRDGRMLPFKNGLGMLVAETDVPVVPCYLHGCFEALRAGAWWPRLHPVSVSIGPPLRFNDEPNERIGWERIAAAVRAAVVKLAPQQALNDSLP